MARALVVDTVPSHHEQWGRVSFEIRGEKGCCCFDSLMIEMQGKGFGALVLLLISYEKLKRHEAMAIRDPRLGWCTT
jgi:hypothetical protein